jgi:hypothetical protein
VEELEGVRLSSVAPEIDFLRRTPALLDGRRCDTMYPWTERKRVHHVQSPEG